MPLVKIDLVKGQRSPEEIKKLADVVQDVLIDKFAAPTRDRYQVGIAPASQITDSQRIDHNTA